MTKEELLEKLHEFGFTGFELPRSERRDGKKRLTWTAPLKNHDGWFTVLLVDERDHLVIEKLENPLGVTFESSNVEEILEYMTETRFLNNLAETDT